MNQHSKYPICCATCQHKDKIPSQEPCKSARWIKENQICSEFVESKDHMGYRIVTEAFKC